MHRHALLKFSGRLLASRRGRGALGLCRALHTEAEDFESKYADKLHQIAKERGMTVSELKTKAQVQQYKERQRLREANEAARLAKEKTETASSVSGSSTGQSPVQSETRKDSSPVKPLSSILNLPRILSLNASQVSALWTAYHASRSEGTGRGFLCASVPVELYEKMTSVASKYPSFVLPVPRPEAQTGAEKKEESDMAYEFYFMEWGFHESPLVPSASEPDVFAPASPKTQAPTGSSNPSTTTILFTPLQEYKMRAAFATPYLVLTHYTDLARTHGIVLLRGEITPATGSGGRYMLSQEDAQILSMGVQKFYLWSDNKAGEESGSGEKILRNFHENPNEFEWKEMLKYGTQTI